jgi:hypothetical protein
MHPNDVEGEFLGNMVTSVVSVQNIFYLEIY